MCKNQTFCKLNRFFVFAVGHKMILRVIYLDAAFSTAVQLHCVKTKSL